MGLTKATVDAFEFNPAGPVKQILWDDDPAGFGVRAYPNGKRSWVVAYRVGRGRGARQRLIVLESTDKLSLAKARSLAKDYQATARHGKDPFEHVYHEDNRPTVRALADRYMKEHAEKRKAPRSVRNDLYLWEHYVLPRIGRKVVALLDRGDVYRLLSDIGKTAPVQANRALALLSKALNLAELWGWRPFGSNPCVKQERFKEGKRSRVLTVDEVQRLNAALDRSSAVVAALVRLYLYTGARPGELPPLRWSPDPAGKEPHIDLENRLILHPRSKTGERTIYLNEQAVAVLRGLGRQPGNPYVFAGEQPGTHLVWVNKSLRNACVRAGIKPVSPYDLRHTFLTWTASAGGVLAAQGAAGHANASMTDRYVHPMENVVRAGVESAGRALQEAVN